jgi:hypothetical protein
MQFAMSSKLRGFRVFAFPMFVLCGWMLILYNRFLIIASAAMMDYDSLFEILGNVWSRWLVITLCSPIGPAVSQ